MRSTLFIFGLLAVPALLSACSASEAPLGPGFRIAIAPLTLPGVTDACYRLTVTNGPDRTGEVVTQTDAVCADRYGDGVGAISYVSPCDTSSARPSSIAKTSSSTTPPVNATPRSSSPSLAPRARTRRPISRCPISR